MRWNWNAPIFVSHHNSDVIYHCGNKVLKSPFRGEYWDAISPDLTTNNPKFLPTGKGGDGNIQYCTITTFDESPLTAGLLWVGTDDGNVQVTRNDGKKWTKVSDNITDRPNGYWVSRVAASNHDPGTAYVSFTGMRRDDFRAFVYKTTDYGATWTSIVANLPKEPINVIQESHKKPNQLFVGTDFMIYISFNGGKSWNKMKNNMPTQPIYDLKIHPRENDLIVATHGRGIWIADIAPLGEICSDSWFDRDAHLFRIEPKIKWISNNRASSSSANFAGESEPNGSMIYFYLKEKAEGDVKVSIYQGNMLISAYKKAHTPGIHKVIWNHSIQKERSEAQKKQMQAQLKRYAEMGFRPRGGQFDVNYTYTPAPCGTYKVVLEVGDKKFVQEAEVKPDHWYK